MGPDRAQQVANVISNRLGTELQLFRDLFRRESLLAETQHLGLAGRQGRRRRARLLVERAGQQPEDADDTFARARGPT